MTRIIFAGTPEFAAISLEAIIHHDFEVALVLTQPDRPKGRGLKPQISAVKQVAQQHHIPVVQPITLRDEKIKSLLRAQHADVMVVAAYGLIIPADVLSFPRYGCLNIHASLLPRWRGAAPIQRAIEADDRETGICIMQMDEGLDTGDIINCHPYNIGDNDTAQTVHDALAQIGANAIVADLQHLSSLTSTPQSKNGACYAKKLQKAEAQLDWHQPAEILHRKIRAFNPVPGAYAYFQGKPFKIWQADVVHATGEPGTVLKSHNHELIIATAQDALSIKVIQPSNKKAMSIQAFLSGHPIAVGSLWTYHNQKDSI